MKRTITLRFSLLGIKQRISRIDLRKTLLALWIIAFLALLSNNSYAQPYCTMACNDLVNISLGGTCEAEIVYDMILEDPDNGAVCLPNGPQAFVVTVMDYANNPIPTSPFITEANIGQTLTVKVKHWATGNSCWSSIYVEDKMPPIIDCAPDITIACSADNDPSITGYPTVTDCSNFTLSHYDAIENFGCNNPVQIITRTWTALDEYNNVSNCMQTIYVEQPNVGNIVFPPNLDGISLPAVDCINPITHPSNTGYPTIDGSMIESGGLCNMAVTYEDTEIPICDPGYKILRVWTVAYWCTGLVINHTQIIKVQDNSPPNLSCPADLSVGTTSSTNCTASVLLPTIGINDNCSSTFTTSINTPSGLITGNGGIIHNISIGVYTVTYNVTDDCGNASDCDIQLTVFDDDSPTMICDEITSVTLNADGMANVFAETFDDGSYDNCCFDYFEVRRMFAGCGEANTYGPFAKFCCEDIGDEVMVQLQGVDCYGNTNSCMVTVLVDDKSDPVISCPPDITLNCTDDYTNLDLTGIATAYDGCGTTDITHSDVVNLNQCSIGTITRTFSVSDEYGNSASCSHTITLIDTTPITVAFPADYDAFGCMGADGLHPDSLDAPFNYPVVTGDDCELIAYNFDDQFFQIAPPACFKILRTWTVIDWCNYDPNSGQTNGYYTGQQILKVFDTEAPVLTCPDDLFVEILESGCSTSVTLPEASATDCSQDVNISVNSDFGLGTGPFSPVGEGVYNATYTAFDGCGNSTSCSIEIVVVDTKNPTPYCVEGLVIEIMNTNPPMIDIWANDFDAGSFDNCGSVQISLSPDVTHQSTTYTCDQLGLQTVQLWVTDEAGNQDYCETFVIIQDNMNLCNPGEDDAMMVGGMIQNEMGYNVETVTVSVNDGITNPIVTGPQGNYEFNNLPVGNDYTVSPEKDMNPLNGVTTLDLAFIRRHILGVEDLPTPYKMIAADVNQSNSITTTDLVELRKLILFVNDNFTNNTSWRFIDAQYEFENPLDPFAEDFPEIYNINNLNTDMPNVDFVGIKIGDVNDSAIANNLLGADDRNKEETFLFELSDRSFKKGEEVVIDFRASDINNLFGYQFTMHFDQGNLEFERMEAVALPEFNESNLGMAFLDEGLITVSWNSSNEINLEQDAVLFRLVFKAKTNELLSNSFGINSDLTLAEAYRGDGALLDVGIQFTDDNSILYSTPEAQLYSNRPNPFHSATIVSFSLPEATDVRLKVYNVSGSLLWSTMGWFEKGYNEIKLTDKELEETGMMIYTIETEDQTLTGRMIRIN